MNRNSSRTNMLRLLKVIFSYKRLHFIASLFMIGNSVSLLVLPFLTMRIIDSAIQEHNVDQLVQYIILYLSISIVQGGCKLMSDYTYSIIGKKIVFDLRLKIVKHLQKLTGKFHANAKAGEIIAVINNDTSMVENLSTSMIFSTVSEICTAIGVFIYLLYMQPDLLLFTILLQPILFVSQHWFNKKIVSMNNEYRDLFGQFIVHIQELIPSIIPIAILKGRKYFLTRFIQTGKNILRKGTKLEVLFSANMVVTSLISSLTTVLILGYGGFKVIDGALTIGGLIAFLQYSQKLLGPIIQMVQINMKYQQSVVSVDRIFNLLDEPIDISQDNRGYSADIKGDIEFRDVSFSYDGNKSVLNGLNLVCGKGSINALVGESGSGKSTLINLLMRFWETDEGEILLDGVNIKEFNLAYLRKSITVVSQDVFLFNDTIYNNILLDKTGVTEQQLIQAAKAADIYDYINLLPDGFHTVIGDRGVKLSGGQKQRIALARAILQDSPILILDEATSALDNITESLINENLRLFLSNKTVIIIAHRLSTVENADQIFVMREGRVIECGTHAELLHSGEYYYNLYSTNVEMKQIHQTLSLSES
ncbi:ABC transporter ATP-binding protein [Paenibacillus durus]|nr:ABC transporter ATP-binding protein [Paenibacillus durus]